MKLTIQYIVFFIISTCFAQTNEYVIKYQNNLSQNDIHEDLRQFSNIEYKLFKKKSKKNPYYNLVKVKAQYLDLSQWRLNTKIKYIEKLQKTFFATDTLPSDSYREFQWEIPFTNTPKAWNKVIINDTNLVVAIVDSGTDFEHEDLQNVYINTKDPINGIDDDGNGYIDDNKGWDFGEFNNIPSVSNLSNHGREMTSLVAATTNNNKGISALSYNVKYMPIKITQDDGKLVDPYEGVNYAIEEGVKIINCSWYQNKETAYSKSIIDFAESKNVLIISASGNDNSSVKTYPAADPRVLAVGAITKDKLKTVSSNYGNWVDIYAPGEQIYVAHPNHTYFPKGGTSVATALTTSACCLLKKIHPNETPSQIISRIKRTGIPFISNEIHGKYLNVYSASEPEEINSFTIYPNPITDGTIHITIPEISSNTLTTLTIYNMLGKVCYTEKKQLTKENKTFTTTLKINPGHYILNIIGQNINKTGQFTLAR